MLFHEAVARGEDLAITVDLGAQAFCTVEALTSQNKKLLTGCITHIVFGRYSVPKALAVVAKAARRVVAVGSGFN